MLNPEIKSSRDSTKKSTKTWLHVAAALGCQELMEALTEKSSLDLNFATSLYCYTPLSLAVMQTKGKFLCHPGSTAYITDHKKQYFKMG